MGGLTLFVDSANTRQDVRQRAESNKVSNPVNNTSFSNKGTNSHTDFLNNKENKLPTDIPVTMTLPPDDDRYTAPNDIVQPTVSFVGITDGAQVSAQTTMTITAAASDNIGVGNVEFLVNGTIICSSAAPFTCNWSVPPQKNIQYVLTVRAYDLTGNISTKSIIVKSV
jgi:hypothetical protein